MSASGLLQELIPSDSVALSEHDVARSMFLRDQRLEDGGDRGYCHDDGDGDPRFWAVGKEFLPNRYSAPGGDLVSALRWSDFYTLSKMRNTPFFAEYDTALLKYHLFVPLPAEPGQTRRVAFWRTNRDYSKRDRLVRRGIPQLTRREKEVLQLAAQGYSNADIAQVLFISVATVAKHMEHIFDPTGVRTRCRRPAHSPHHPPKADASDRALCSRSRLPEAGPGAEGCCDEWP